MDRTDSIATVDTSLTSAMIQSAIPTPSAQDRHALRRAPGSSRRAVPEYLKRLFDPKQMDFQSALSQMMHILRSPSEIYKMSHYHKEIKNQWARDDPAFVVLLVAALCGASLLYAIAFHCASVSEYLTMFFHLIVFDFFVIGALIASTTRWVANTYLKPQTSIAFAVEQEVEWGFAWDIHCNSFFGLFLMLHVLQFVLYPILSSSDLLPTILSNALYAAAFSYYCYITFLGFTALSFVRNAQYFLLPVLPIAVLLVLSIIFRFNMTEFVLSFYFS